MIEAKKVETVLWQLPPSFKRDDERLEAALEAIADRAPCRHAVELRHPSWFTADVYDLLRSYRAALVIADDPKFPFVERKLTTSWTYIRFHRGRAGARGAYSPKELDTWRRRIAAWRARTEVVAYFNNDWEAFAVDNARRLGSAFG